LELDKQIAELLPPPITRPAATSEVLKALRGARRAVAEEALTDQTVFLRVRTRTWADVGGWFGPRPLDIFVTNQGLVLIAAGLLEFESPAPLAVSVPYSDLTGSTYNYATGRLALAPAEQSPIKSVRIAPADAQQLLAQIHDKGT
jgi:hypothetical protein